METIIYKAESGSEAKTGVILRKLEQLVCKYPYLVLSGWRLILKMQVEGESEPYYHIDVQSNKGGGSYAKAKMSTLERHTKHDSTGNDSFCELREILGPWRDRDECKQIFALNNIDALTKDMSIWLRDNVGFTHYYGGIRIPYEDKVVEGDKILTEFGEIRIAFSGASSEQDLFFALMIFRALNNSFVKLYPNTQVWLDLRKLQKVPAVKFWLDLLEIEEA
jgi:hypothetical protein